MRPFTLTAGLASLGLLLLCAPLVGCGAPASSTGGGQGGDGGAGGGAGGSTAQSGPTFHKDIEPILQRSCQSCHSPGSIAPFSVVTYEDAKLVSTLMKEQTASRKMPPWGAFETSECTPKHGFRDDLRLTQAEIDLFAAWSDNGAPEGDPADAPPPIDFKGADLPGMDMEIQPVTPYVSSGDKDQFRCFVMDPGFDQDVFLNGWHFIAGNPEVVHHALLFVDPNAEGDALADADGGYDCFGGSGVNGSLIAAWAPGGVPFELPANIGTRLPKGSRLVMQIHYHPVGVTADPDSTRIQMRFTQSPEYEMAVALIGNMNKQSANGDGLQPGPSDAGKVEFRIPAEASNHTETMLFTLPDTINGGPMPDLYVYGSATHMHYVGRDMKIEVEHKSPKSSETGTECLLQTPDWDFSWQRTYVYDTEIQALPRFLPGDVLRMRCTYDNTLANPYVQRALKDQGLQSPVDVYLGEETLDEMCLSALSLIYKVK
ncbi:MAG: hypothetical protein R3F14_41040 [Polyangiaceae bacterium]